jgi:hypothetical protein
MRLSGVGCECSAAWQFAQAVRWAAMGEIFVDDGAGGSWVACSSGFGGFGFYGGKGHIVLNFFLEHYAPLRWPERGTLFLYLP